MNDRTKKIVFVAMLSALGAILNLVEIPYVIPFLNFDLSEVIMLIAVATVGLKSAFFIAVVKGFISFLIKGPVGPMAIGQIAGLMGSLIIAFSFYYFYKYLKKNMVLSLTLTCIVFAVAMTILNYLFITPVYFSYVWYTQLAPEFNASMFIDWDISKFLPFLSIYAKTIIVVYLPFNLIKGILFSLVYYSVQRIESIMKL